MKKLDSTQIQKLFSQLETGWDVVHDDHLEREYKFKDFKTALKFVNEIGEVAEKLNHHPNIEFSWGYVKLRIWTHDIGGLSEKDFMLAKKIDELL